MPTGRVVRWGVGIAIVLVPVVLMSFNDRQRAAVQASNARPIAQHQAEALLHDVVRKARTGDHAALCRDLASDPHAGMCRFLLDGADQAGWEPGTDSPEVVGVTHRDGTERSATIIVLHLAGARADGSAYTSDFRVERAATDDDPDRLLATTPIYWSGVHFVVAPKIG